MRSEHHTHGYEIYLEYSDRWQNWPRHINHYRKPPQREYEDIRMKHAMVMLDACLLAMFEARAGRHKLDNAIRLHNSGERIKAIKAFRALHPGMTIKDAKEGIEAEVSLVNNHKR